MTTGASTYQVGEVTFECGNLSVPDINNCLLTAGYQAEPIMLETCQAVLERECSGIVSAMAQLAG